MNEKKEDPFGMNSMIDTWMKPMVDIWWGAMAGQWAAVQGSEKNGAPRDSGDPDPKTKAAMDAAFKNFKIMSEAMAGPGSFAALFNGNGALPEVLLRFAQTFLGGFFEMQHKMIERLGRVSVSAEAYKFHDIDDNIFRAWTETYEKEFKQFFQIPQLGLMRVYQEKVNKVFDRYNFFQSTCSEFLNLLVLPFDRTMQVMQANISEMAEKGTLPEDTKVYYDMWVKVLEGNYMTLFQTPEYIETLARTINSLADFSAARNAALEDMLSQFPVARRSEVDDMARELYELKKRLKKLEKEQNS